MLTRAGGQREEAREQLHSFQARAERDKREADELRKDVQRLEAERQAMQQAADHAAKVATEERERERTLRAEAESSAQAAQSDLKAQATTLKAKSTALEHCQALLDKAEADSEKQRAELEETYISRFAKSEILSSALAHCQALLGRAKADNEAQAQELTGMARERDDIAAQLRQAKELLGQRAAQASALQDDVSVMQDDVSVMLRTAAQRHQEPLHRDAHIRALEQGGQVEARKSRSLENLTETLKHDLESKDRAMGEQAQLKRLELHAEEHASSFASAREHDLREIDKLKKDRDHLRCQLANAGVDQDQSVMSILPLKLAAVPCPLLQNPQAPKGPVNSRHSLHSSHATTLSSSPAESAVVQPLKPAAMVVAKCQAGDDTVHLVQCAHTHVQQQLVCAAMEGEDFSAEAFASELILEAQEYGRRSRHLSSSPPPPARAPADARQGAGRDTSDHILRLPAPLPALMAVGDTSAEPYLLHGVAKQPLKSEAVSHRSTAIEDKGQGKHGGDRPCRSMSQLSACRRNGNGTSSARQSVGSRAMQQVRGGDRSDDGSAGQYVRVQTSGATSGSGNTYCSQASVSVSEQYCTDDRFSVHSDSSAEGLVFDQALHQPLPISTKLQKVQQILQEPSRASPPVMSNHLRELHAERDSRTERERERETQRERERILALEREEREYEDRLFGPGHAGNRPTSPALEDMLAVSVASLRARVMHHCARARTRAR
jgi:hypothetical protein